FNGEIFNFVELRNELLGYGHVFRTHSDTEIIVHAYEQWGEAAFARFNGQFAIALWHRKQQQLTLVRDRVGVRPLYFCLHAGRLYFASELKAIFASDPSISREFDPAGIDDTFTFWSPIDERTAFRSIRQLRPGELMTVTAHAVHKRTYWQPQFPPSVPMFEGSLDDAAHAVRAALDEATRLRIVRADVPVGCYLSGGIDSSLIAALGRKHQGATFHTFSLRFADAEYDETPYQRLMAEQLQTTHHEVVVQRRDIAAWLPDVVWHAERPLLRTAPAPMFGLAQLVAQTGIKVVLTGEGADEFFGGYDIFREGAVRRFWSRHPASPRGPRMLEQLYPYLQRSPVAQRALAAQFFARNLDQAQQPGFAHEPRFRATAALKRLFSAQLRDALGDRNANDQLLATLPADIAAWAPLAQDQYVEMRTLLAPYLLAAQGDRMMMAHSIEGRFPFLDLEVMTLANSLPAAYKLNGLREKAVLKHLAGGLIPDQLIHRAKQPFRAPDALAFVQDPPPWLTEELRPEAIAAVGIFDAPTALALWAKCQRQNPAIPFSNSDNMALIGLISTQLLASAFRTMVAKPAAFQTCIELTTTV
nr:asparagine synthase (glutamine-hydrolyzing) [Kofleriaceae bacterium]